MKRAAFSLLLTIASLTAACSASTGDEDAEATSSELGATLSPAQLAATKQALRDLS